MKQEFESPHLAKQLKQNIMEEILKKMMNAKCVSMHNNQFRCYGKGCNGSCAHFQATLMAVKEKITEAQKSFVESMTLYNSEQEFSNCENI